jgi:methylenetetrahydrofolate dehydrogenase (NADP+)/methenyltetrahydrofolate cyclohydrolase
MSQPSGARLMTGTALARDLLADTTRRARRFLDETGRRPCLAAVLVGEDSASFAHVNMKRSRCIMVGIEARVETLTATATTGDVVAKVKELSKDPLVDGILVQNPVPAHVDERTVFEAIDPHKDVEGVTTHAFARVAFGLPGPVSCTAEGIIRLLDHYEVALAGMHAVIIGRSPLLGNPVGMRLLARDATVTYCHPQSRDLDEIVRNGDIVVAAVGRPGLVQGSWLKRGAVVIDAGHDTDTVGDVEFDDAQAVASLLTPVPGGVGPVTIAVLLQQTIETAERLRTSPAKRRRAPSRAPGRHADTQTDS